ncbi:MAG: hypothetical protein V1843_01005, partial [bacterium]
MRQFINTQFSRLAGLSGRIGLGNFSSQLKSPAVTANHIANVAQPLNRFEIVNPNVNAIEVQHFEPAILAAAQDFQPEAISHTTDLGLDDDFNEHAIQTNAQDPYSYHNRLAQFNSFLPSSTMMAMGASIRDNAILSHIFKTNQVYGFHLEALGLLSNLIISYKIAAMVHTLVRKGTDKLFAAHIRAGEHSLPFRILGKKGGAIGSSLYLNTLRAIPFFGSLPLGYVAFKTLTLFFTPLFSMGATGLIFGLRAVRGANNLYQNRKEINEIKRLKALADLLFPISLWSTAILTKNKNTAENSSLETSLRVNNALNDSDKNAIESIIRNPLRSLDSIANLKAQAKTKFEKRILNKISSLIEEMTVSSTPQSLKDNKTKILGVIQEIIIYANNSHSLKNKNGEYTINPHLIKLNEILNLTKEYLNASGRKDKMAALHPLMSRLQSFGEKIENTRSGLLTKAVCIMAIIYMVVSGVTQQFKPFDRKVQLALMLNNLKRNGVITQAEEKEMFNDISDYLNQKYLARIYADGPDGLVPWNEYPPQEYKDMYPRGLANSEGLGFWLTKAIQTTQPGLFRELDIGLKQFILQSSEDPEYAGLPVWAINAALSPTGNGGQIDYTVATDAVIEIIVAYIQAQALIDQGTWDYEKMGISKDHCKKVADNLTKLLWKKLVTRVDTDDDGKGDFYVLRHGSDQSYKQGKTFLMHPDYFDPAFLRIIAEFDSKHDWDKVIRDNYAITEAILKSTDYASIPEKCRVTIIDNDVIKVEVVEEEGAGAVRLAWKLARAVDLYQDPKALKLLKELAAKGSLDDKTNIMILAINAAARQAAGEDISDFYESIKQMRETN